METVGVFPELHKEQTGSQRKEMRSRIVCFCQWEIQTHLTHNTDKSIHIEAVSISSLSIVSSNSEIL